MYADEWKANQFVNVCHMVIGTSPITNVSGQNELHSFMSLYWHKDLNQTLLLGSISPHVWTAVSGWNTSSVNDVDHQVIKSYLSGLTSIAWMDKCHLIFKNAFTLSCFPWKYLSCVISQWHLITCRLFFLYLTAYTKNLHSLQNSRERFLLW